MRLPASGSGVGPSLSLDASTGWRARWESWARALGWDRAVSAKSLAFVRIAVGLVMLLEAISLFLPSESSGGRSHLDVYYAGREVTFHLPYAGFEWLPLLPTPWIQGVGVLLGLGAIGMGLGFRLRASRCLFRRPGLRSNLDGFQRQGIAQGQFGQRG